MHLRCLLLFGVFKIQLASVPRFMDVTLLARRNSTGVDGWSWEGHLEYLGCNTHRS